MLVHNAECVVFCAKLLNTLTSSCPYFYLSVHIGSTINWEPFAGINDEGIVVFFKKVDCFFLFVGISDFLCMRILLKM